MAHLFIWGWKNFYSSFLIATLSNVGIDGLQIDGPNIHDQASTLWLFHKNGPPRFVWYHAKGAIAGNRGKYADTVWLYHLYFAYT